MEILSAKMLRVNEDNTLVYYYEFSGDSTDTKPTDNVANGSTFTEVDTGDVYMFNGKTSTWVRQFSLQG